MSEPNDSDESTDGLITNLHKALGRLADNPCPYVTGPESVKKRASVALVIRIQPAYAHWPVMNTEPTRDLDSFFAQDWVEYGEPEVLFIKRAARKGDRWTSHLALPGGRRDPEDVDDQHAAMREAAEEVGLDLSGNASIAVGNLPQRVVTTSWGKVPLMVLCPYVYLLTRHDIPPLRLQPTEVASTHWVPIRALLSPAQRTVTLEDVSSRLANQETGIKRWMLRAMLGRMEFAAIQLIPTESLYCHESPTEDLQKRNAISLATLFSPKTLPEASQHRPLLLWGLTLGVVADFLDLFPPHNALKLWTYPTFTSPDVRFVIWLMTYTFRRTKRQQIELNRLPGAPVAAVEEGLDNISLTRERSNEVGLGGLGTGGSGRSVESAIGALLEGYYSLLRRGVASALIIRAFGFSAFAAWLWIRHRHRLR